MKTCNHFSGESERMVVEGSKNAEWEYQSCQKTGNSIEFFSKLTKNVIYV